MVACTRINMNTTPTRKNALLQSNETVLCLFVWWYSGENRKENTFKMVVIQIVGHFWRKPHQLQSRDAMRVNPRTASQNRNRKQIRRHFPSKSVKILCTCVFIRRHLRVFETGLLTSSGFLPRFSSSIRFSIVSSAKCHHRLHRKHRFSPTISSNVT